jgi:hypothetical protein
MSWTRFAATVSAAVLAGWAVSASALDDEYGRSGPYIGAGGLYAFENFSGAAESPTPDGSGGYNLKGGYRFNEYFALEIDWDHMISFAQSTGDTEIWDIGANAKFFPLHGIVQPFVSVGGAWSSVDDPRAASARDSTGFAARFGLGLDVYVHRNWALSLESDYLLQTGGRADYDAIPISLGVTYRFY